MRFAKTLSVAVGVAAISGVWALSHLSMFKPSASGHPRPSEPAASAQEVSRQEAESAEILRLKARMAALEREVSRAPEKSQGEAASAAEPRGAGDQAEPPDPAVQATMMAQAKRLAKWSLALWIGAITAGRLLAYTYKYLIFPC